VKLSEKTKKERKEHEDLRDSTACRLTYKLTGRKDKFQARANKEEQYVRLLLGFGRYLNTSVDREYVEALEQKMRERDRQTVLGQLLSEANQIQTLSPRKGRTLRIAQSASWSALQFCV